jgi:DNA-binding NtrC family response regulator
MEDDTALRSVLTEVFADEGLNVMACDSPAAIQRAVRDGLGDVAVIDFWGSSYVSLDEPDRRALVEFATAIPTILVSGRPWAQAVTAQELGVLSIVPKPMDVFALTDLVQRAAAAVRSFGGLWACANH